MVDSDYAAVGRGEPPSRAPATSCPTSREQRKLECVADPRLSAGPAGEPDRQCYNLLAPNYDADVWRVTECWATQCPEPFSDPLMTPASKLPPVCNPSRPLVEIINPIVDWRDVINPNQTYPFPDGTVLPIPLSLSALR